MQLQREDRADLGARGHQKVTTKSMGAGIPTKTSVALRRGRREELAGKEGDFCLKLLLCT